MEKLLLLIDEIGNEEENLWFKQKIQSKYNVFLENNYKNDNSINKIYEYCIKEIITNQANKFYEDFKLTEIKSKLIEDFIRMEHFRREDNFEDFCLAMYQQIENIVNHLFSNYSVLENSKRESKNFVISIYDKEIKKFIKSTYGITVDKLIFQKYKPEETVDLKTQTWYFMNKFRAILYYFYFNSKIEFNTSKFEEIYNDANELYQVRNLNHRGGEKSEYQQKLYNEIIPRHSKYYFKFLGFLEDFISTLNQNITPVH